MTAHTMPGSSGASIPANTTPPKRPDPIDYLTGKLSDAPYPQGISLPGRGGKFTTDGRVQHWPGNTFICHVNPRSEVHDALRELQEQLKTGRFQRFFAFMPPASFHMTVFQGTSPKTMTEKELPRGGHPGQTRDDLTGVLQDATRDLALPTRFRVRMADLFAGYSVTMEGAGDAENDKLRDCRRKLREATGLTSDNFDDYVFHITLAYLVDWVSPALAHDIVQNSRALTEQFRPRIGEIDLGPIELCNFDTMHQFDIVSRLGA